MQQLVHDLDERPCRMCTNLVVYIQNPVGPYFQAIDTLLCFARPPYAILGLEVYFNCLSSLSSSADDLEESKTTQHSSEIGD